MRHLLTTSLESEQPLTDKSAILLGTINGSTWRDELIPKLTVNYFNPVVADWTTEDQRREEQAKSACGIWVYVLTPKMKGFFSIVELTLACVTAAATGKHVVMCILTEDGGVQFDNHQNDSFNAMENLLMAYGNVEVAETLDVLAEMINRLGANDQPPIA